MAGHDEGEPACFSASAQAVTARSIRRSNDYSASSGTFSTVPGTMMPPAGR
jgi:hypothetical protein